MLSTVKKYLYQPGLWWTCLLTTFSVAQLLIGRNNKEAIYFFLAAVAVTALNFFFAYKSKTLRESYYSLAIFLIPAVIVAVYAAASMPKETTAGDYKEIENGLKYAKEGIDKRLLIVSVMDALSDGKISRWESNALIKEIFDRNGFLMRDGEPQTQREARQQLQDTLYKLKPVVVINETTITASEGIYQLISIDGKCKYQFSVMDSTGNFVMSVNQRQCMAKQVVVRDENYKASMMPLNGYFTLPISAGTKLYLFEDKKQI